MGAMACCDSVSPVFPWSHQGELGPAHLFDSLATRISRTRKDKKMKRRAFMKMLGVGACGAALAPLAVMAGKKPKLTSEAHNRLREELGSSDHFTWRDLYKIRDAGIKGEPLCMNGRPVLPYNGSLWVYEPIPGAKASKPDKDGVTWKKVIMKRYKVVNGVICLDHDSEIGYNTSS